jgi:hypothetical protein
MQSLQNPYKVAPKHVGQQRAQAAGPPKMQASIHKAEHPAIAAPQDNFFSIPQS